MKSFLIIAFFGLNYFNLTGQTQTDYSEKELIYGRKDGMALTMLALSPKNSGNGKAIISMVSGAWYSNSEWIPGYIKNSEILLHRGYTIFLVMHSGRPVYTILDAIADTKRAVRFVRFHSSEYKIDPAHIGITGTSSGAHLSLVIATDDDQGDPTARDPVDRISSRVQAVACFYPPSDFLHWGKMDIDPMNKSVLDEADVYAAFEFKEWDPRHKHFVVITDKQKLLEITRQISPFYQISPDDPPILIAHGNADVMVPFSQSERFIEKLKQENIPCSLLVKQGGGHGGWKDEIAYEKTFADWFDKYLK
jgi:acetyl esterase/lipase